MKLHLHRIGLRKFAAVIFMILAYQTANAQAASTHAAQTRSTETKPKSSKQKISHKAKATPKSIIELLWNRQISPTEIKDLKKIVNELRDRDYDKALKNTLELKQRAKSSELLGSNALTDLVRWKKFSYGGLDPKKNSFAEIAPFIINNPFFPNQNDMRRNAEQSAIFEKIPYDKAKDYFKSRPPLTADSKIYWLKTKGKDQPSSVRSAIAEAFRSTNFSSDSEKIFLKEFGSQLTESDYLARIERLMWDGRDDDAKRMLNLLNDSNRELFSEAINFNNYSDTSKLAKILAKPHVGEITAYRAALWYSKSFKNSDVLNKEVDESKLERPIELLLRASGKNSDQWWPLRKFYFRELIKKQKYKIAYRIISEHGLKTSAKDYWAGEWISGWIALRFLDHPKTSYTHFEKLYQNVTQPISISRALYWMAMAKSAEGDEVRAKELYQEAAEYPMFFYGQLAITKLREMEPDSDNYGIDLPAPPKWSKEDIAALSQSKPLKIAYLLALFSDEADSITVFESTIANAKDEGEVAVIMEVAKYTNLRQVISAVAKICAKYDIFFVKDQFQIVPQVGKNKHSALIHGIIKQESAFNPKAESPTGAMGYMQLMPDTAKRVAKDLKIKHKKSKLQNIDYNVKLGSHYIKSLVDYFNGSEILAIAAYNGGPTAVERWISEFYDPRNEENIDEVVDWIELITYSETRNYVQRVIENKVIYQYLMNQEDYLSFN